MNGNARIAAIAILAGLSGAPAGRTAHSAGRTWTQEGFQDFSRGDFGRSIANLYVTASGRVEMPHRWDLNNDGWFDVVLGNSHDIAWVKPLFLFRNEGGRLAPKPLELPSGGSRR